MFIINLSKSFLSFFFVLLFVGASMAQENRFIFSFEYNPNISKITNKLISNKKYKISHNSFIRLEYKMTDRLYPTFAMGFFNTGDQSFQKLNGELDLENIRFINHHNYLVVPMGVRIIIGKYYIHPEIGFDLGVSHNTKSIVNYTDGTRKTNRFEQQLHPESSFNRTTLPLFLNVGRTIELDRLTLLVGLKGYFGLKKMVHNVPKNNHYYGFGLSVGLRFGN